MSSFQYPRQVRLVDTDASGFAHFTTYVRMMEETEYAFLRSRGLSVKLQDERGVMGFPRLSAAINIDHPLVFDQQVTVSLTLVRLDGKALEYEFKICDEHHRTCVTGQFTVAVCRFPDDKPPYAILTPDRVTEALATYQSFEGEF